METAFFRYSEFEKDKNKVYSTTLLSLILTTSIFITAAICFAQPIAELIKYPNNSEYVIWFGLIISFDALSAIPFAKLRSQNRAKRFVIIKSISIGINVGLNFFFLLLCPYLLENNILTDFVDYIYRGKVGVGYIFISNLIASAFTLILLLPDIIDIKYRFDYDLWKKMLKYAFPLLIFGLAGIVNETLDRILIKYLLPESIAMSQLGIYGACYKISIMMTIFIQAFRYAAEPFFFSHAKDGDAKTLYADIMKFFIIIMLFIFLGIMLYIDIVKYFIGENYHSGLKVVPILLFANLFLGVFYNLSIWYKLNDLTKYGAYMAIFGAIITIVLNYLLIPKIGYMGAAWATFFCYLSMMLISYFIGKKYYPVNYNLKRIFSYFILALILYFINTNTKINIESIALKFSVNTILLLIFLTIVFYKEKIYKLMLKN
jgi:O-antigen/teichoic acid export membrane protein